jgi:phage recombination protein Bet
MNKGLTTIPEQPQQINYNSEQVQLIKSVYAAGATSSEFELLLYMSKQYNLDILTKEIFFMKYGGVAQIFAGRDGFLTLAHRSGMFDGMKSGTNGSVRGGDLVGYCEVFRKDMTNTFYVEVDFLEYNGNSKIWKEKPKTMIQKVAESQALRKAFNISGIYSPEEFNTLPDQPQQLEPQQAPQDKIKPKVQAVKEIAKIQQDKVEAQKKLKETKKALKEKELINLDQKAAIWDQAKSNKMTLPDLIKFSYKHVKQKELKDLTYLQAVKLYEDLKNMEMVEQEFNNFNDLEYQETFIDTPFQTKK